VFVVSHAVLSLGLSVTPALIGLALLAWGYPWIATVFFVAAGFGVAADLATVVKARRAPLSKKRRPPI
jgi:hypothetical protein